jgi:hypothetical protein
LPIIAKVANNLCPRRLPNEWLCRCAALPPPTGGVRTVVNYAMRETCILAHLPSAAGHDVILIVSFGDRCRTNDRWAATPHPNSGIPIL